MPKNNKKCNFVIAKQKANRKKNHYFAALHEIKNVQPLRTLAPIVNAHIFYASRVHPARSRDSCMCSGAKIKF